MVRYKVKPGMGEVNEARVRAVYAQLEREQPAGLRYATFRLGDGVTFVHIAAQERDGDSILPTFSAFKEFTTDLSARCEEAPMFAEFTEVGSYGLQKK
jgi:hypothetical protein